MNRNKKANDSTNSISKVKFEDTVEGKKILNSISAAFQNIRKENEYNGEARIMQNLSKKNKTKFYTNNFEDDLDKLIRNKTEGRQKTSQDNDVMMPQGKNNERYNRITPPKN
jgi:non-homologous end joining protein Ku